MIEYKKVDYEFWGKLIGEIESQYSVLKFTTLNFIKKIRLQKTYLFIG